MPRRFKDPTDTIERLDALMTQLDAAGETEKARKVETRLTRAYKQLAVDIAGETWGIDVSWRMALCMIGNAPDSLSDRQLEEELKSCRKMVRDGVY